MPIEKHSSSGKTLAGAQARAVNSIRFIGRDIWTQKKLLKITLRSTGKHYLYFLGKYNHVNRWNRVGLMIDKISLLK